MQEKESVIDIRKQKFNKDIPTVLYIIRDEGGCGFYRCLQPAMSLRRRGLMNTITDLRNTTPEHIMQADVVVFQELGSTISLEAFNFAQSKGKITIVEIDDYLHVVSPRNPGYEAWNPSTLYIHRFIQQLQRANAVTVSTPQLAREYFPYNQNIFVLPNYLNEEKWSNNQSKNKDGHLRIGWAGGNAHIDDLRLIAKPIERIIREYKNKVKFENMGMTKGELSGVFNLEEFNAVCPNCNYQGETMTHNAETLDNYPMMLAMKGWDIALAPIVDNAFNSAKSDLKIKEYAATGYPIIASKVTPYIEAQEAGANILLAKSFDEWYNNIKMLIEDHELRRKMVKDNKEWVSKYWIDDNIYKYFDVYTQVINKFKKK